MRPAQGSTAVSRVLHMPETASPASGPEHLRRPQHLSLLGAAEHKKGAAMAAAIGLEKAALRALVKADLRKFTPDLMQLESACPLRVERRSGMGFPLRVWVLLMLTRE